jgi:hypothetical protein
MPFKCTVHIICEKTHHAASCKHKDLCSNREMKINSWRIIIRKYVLVIIALLLLSLLSGCINRGTSATTKDQVTNRLVELQKQYQDKLSQGYELNETENLAIKAKQAYEAGNYDVTSKYLDQAFQKLSESKKSGGVTPAIPSPTPVTTTPEPPGHVNVPNEYKDFNDKTTLWLDTKLAEWKPKEKNLWISPFITYLQVMICLSNQIRN